MIENLPDDYVEWLQIPNHPKDAGKGSHMSPFTKEVYIEQGDFRLQEEKDFFGLAPGKVSLTKALSCFGIQWYNFLCKDCSLALCISRYSKRSEMER